MAANIKQTFIEALRLTPEGIADFLATPIPEAPTVATPTDVDAAIIANGICAKYVLDLFQPFAGLTPIEMILRVGQHSNVAEAMLLSGLEYMGTSSDQADLEILEPSTGASYLPGELRLRAQAKNGTLIQVAVEIGEHAPVSLDNTDGVFEGFITLEELGEYTATFTGLFDDEETTKTATVNFTIAEAGADTEPPGGKDKDALDKAYGDFMTAINNLLYAIAENSPIGFILDKFDLVKAAFDVLKSVAGIAGASAQEVLDQAGEALTAVKDKIVESGGAAAEEIEAFLGDAIAAVQNAVSQLLDLFS